MPGLGKQKAVANHATEGKVAQASESATGSAGHAFLVNDMGLGNPNQFHSSSPCSRTPFRLLETHGDSPSIKTVMSALVWTLNSASMFSVACVSVLQAHNRPVPGIAVNPTSRNFSSDKLTR